MRNAVAASQGSIGSPSIYLPYIYPISINTSTPRPHRPTEPPPWSRPRPKITPARAEAATADSRQRRTTAARRPTQHRTTDITFSCRAALGGRGERSKAFRPYICETIGSRLSAVTGYCCYHREQKERGHSPQPTTRSCTGAVSLSARAGTGLTPSG